MGGADLRAVGGRGRRARGSDQPALTTGSPAVVVLCRRRRDLQPTDTKRQTGDESGQAQPKNHQSGRTSTFEGGVPEALGARGPSREHIRSHVGGRDHRGSIPRGQLGLRLVEDRGGNRREAGTEQRKKTSASFTVSQ